MPTRLGYYADKAVEWGWLLVAVFAPLFFNVYSSRVFEPDKITTIRSIVLLMLARVSTAARHTLLHQRGAASVRAGVSWGPGH